MNKKLKTVDDVDPCLEESKLPCDECKTFNVTPLTINSNFSRQCAWICKQESGLRCKRRVRHPSGYCQMHRDQHTTFLDSVNTTMINDTSDMLLQYTEIPTIIMDYVREDHMITRWSIPQYCPSITLPFVRKYYEYDHVVVDWGDGTITQGMHKHTYSDEKKGNTVEIHIHGEMPAWDFSMQPTSQKYIEAVVQWGPNADLNRGHITYGFFRGCTRLTYVAQPNDISGSLQCMFRECTSFNQDISEWDTSRVTDMSYMFNCNFNRSVFNQNISKWDVGNVTNMQCMFRGARVFNQDIGQWKTNNVTDMSQMFMGARSFNQDIGRWNTENVIYMQAMFQGACIFNQDIGRWNTGKVTDMSQMFQDAHTFDQDIGQWKTNNVTDMSQMFQNAHTFDHDIGRWDTGKVSNMSQMFRNAHTFNQDIGQWKTNNVTNMSQMFEDARSFNQDIGRWNTENVIYSDKYVPNFPGCTHI
jgi:surface protein